MCIRCAYGPQHSYLGALCSYIPHISDHPSIFVDVCGGEVGGRWAFGCVVWPLRGTLILSEARSAPGDLGVRLAADAPTASSRCSVRVGYGIGAQDETLRTTTTPSLKTLKKTARSLDLRSGLRGRQVELN